MVDEYSKDTIEVYYKFENEWLINEFEEARSRFEMKKMEELALGQDSVSIVERLAIFDDNVEIDFEGIKVKYYERIEKLEKSNKKRVDRYAKGKFNKRKKLIPLAYISSPIISENGKYAIVYCSYVCGNLCGCAEYQYFKKDNNKWVIYKYELRLIF